MYKIAAAALLATSMTSSASAKEFETLVCLSMTKYAIFASILTSAGDHFTIEIDLERTMVTDIVDIPAGVACFEDSSTE